MQIIQRMMKRKSLLEHNYNTVVGKVGEEKKKKFTWHTAEPSIPCDKTSLH